MAPVPWKLEHTSELPGQAAVAQVSGPAALELPPAVMMAVAVCWCGGGWPLRRDGDGWRMDGPQLSTRFMDIGPRSLRMTVRIATAGLPEAAWPVLCDRRVSMRAMNLARLYDVPALAERVGLPDEDVAEVLDCSPGAEDLNAVATRQCLLAYCDRCADAATLGILRTLLRRQRDAIAEMKPGAFIRVRKSHTKRVYTEEEEENEA